MILSFVGGTHALRLCSVPLDVSHGLQELRQSLSQTAYTARALQHSRRLLVLYLAGQMNGELRFITFIWFLEFLMEVLLKIVYALVIY